MDITNKVRAYILENFLFSEDQSLLKDNDSFIDTGIIDSTGIIEVIMFLEETFGIQVKTEEMLPENLDSVTRITTFVNHKIGVAQ